MLGKNPQRPAALGDGTKLFVKNIFKTIQGEGPNVGMPSIFIRLGGCNLACNFCDTEFEDYIEMNTQDIINIAENLSLNLYQERSVSLIVITGGEPFRQNISMLCSELINKNFQVQIETNGTLYHDIAEEVEIICSPKIRNNKYYPPHSRILPRITAFKFLVSSNIEGYGEVPQLGQKEFNIPVFVQPIDQYNNKQNKANERLAIDIAINNGYRLSYQIHKKLEIE
ncbi:MAG: 7-carboxy-7-deazaguanine synthase QueE [Rickettsiaceae bacterium]|nr:7-carboxy-7-deazaguanine synthase QueE [Rickettsiaceae bacterium]